MLNNEWKMVKGTATASDECSGVAAKKNADGTVSIAYEAYGGLKVLNLSKVSDIADTEVSSENFDAAVSAVQNASGDDWEAMIMILSDGVAYPAYIDDCNVVTVLPNGDNALSEEPEVDEGFEYEAEEFDTVDEELLRLFDFMEM